MRFFDLHCDTLTEALRSNSDLLHNSMQLDLCRGAYLDAWVQCFAVWIPDRIRGQDAWRFFDDAAWLLQKQAAQHMQLRLCRSVQDIEHNTAKGFCCALLTVEGAAALGGYAEHMADLAKAGTQMMTLTWNGANELGDGVGVKKAAGLTPFGKQVLGLMPRYGVRIDISHASPALFDSVLENTASPVLASHSNAKKLCAHPRNLTDDQFMRIRQRGGIVGLNFYTSFLRDGGTATMYDILRHCDYFLSLGGEDNLCMGSDFDGAVMPQGLTGIESIGALYELFLRHNYNETLLDKIFYRNALEFFRRTEPADRN